MFAALAGLTACTKLPMFTQPADQSEAIEVRSLTEGEILKPGEPITFVIHSGSQDGNALNLEIILSTVSGIRLWSTNESAPSINQELDLILPDLETGQYKIEFVISQETGATSQKELTFFYTPGEYSLVGIKSFPPTIFPGSESILKADLEYPAGADPFIRWTQNNKTIAGGLISGGWSEIIWSAPEEEGVYSIQVELFPFPPIVESDFHFTSPISMTARLYVSTKHILSENDLAPEESYYSLFHFNGDLQDFGASRGETSQVEAENPFQAELLGNPHLVSVGDHFGYRLTGSSGIKYPRLIFPVKSGQLQPFTLTIVLLIDSSSRGKDLVSVVSPGGSFSFLLYLDREGSPAAAIEAGGREVRLSSGIDDFKTGQEYSLSLSIIPQAGSVTALWFLDGVQTAFSVQNIELKNLTNDGETLIGGTNGFQGIITELGVFNRDEKNRAAVDPEIFKRAMKKKYGRNLVLAEGFDGLYLTDELSSKVSGTLEYGSLILGLETALTLPAFEVSAERTVVEISFSRPVPPGSRISLFWENSQNPFFALRADPDTEQTTQIPYSIKVDKSLKLALSIKEIIIESPDFESPDLQSTFKLRKQDTETSWVVLNLSSSASELMEIDQIIIYQSSAY